MTYTQKTLTNNPQTTPSFQSLQTQTFAPDKVQDFKRLFTKLLASKSPTVAIWTITPWMAEIMIAKNFTTNRKQSPTNKIMIAKNFTTNRKQSPTNKAKMAKAMISGEFFLTGQGLSFCKDRLLGDGGNRIQTCIDWDVEFTTLVMFGVVNEARSAFDTGTVRSPANVFEINDVADAKKASSTTKAYVVYSNNPRRGQMATTGFSGNITQGITHKNMVDIYKTTPDLQLAVGDVYHRMGSPKLLVASHATAIACLMRRVNKKETDDFLEAVLEGLGIQGATDPAYVLRQKLLNSAARKTNKIPCIKTHCLSKRGSTGWQVVPTAAPKV
jgi:hypothetical protein